MIINALNLCRRFFVAPFLYLFDIVLCEAQSLSTISIFLINQLPYIPSLVGPPWSMEKENNYTTLACTIASQQLDPFKSQRSASTLRTQHIEERLNETSLNESCSLSMSREIVDLVHITRIRVKLFKQVFWLIDVKNNRIEEDKE